MKGSRILLALLAAMLGSGWAAAQHAGGRAAGPAGKPANAAERSISSRTPHAALTSSRAEALPPSDAELEAFVQVYAELQKTAQTFEREVAGAETAQQVRALRLEHRRANQTVLRKHSWTREEFMRVARALNDDPALAERAVHLFGDGP